MTDKEMWYETLHAGFGQYFSVDKVLYREQTGHQDLVIFENSALGRVMTLDGVVQTTERDEFIYHEMMTHVPLLAHGAAKHVLIIGGGDGAMLREVSRHQNIEKITMVEIDAGVVTFCKQYLPNHSQGAYDDPRFTLVIDDGVNFVSQTGEKFDVIISDCTDPIGPGKACLPQTSIRDATAALILAASSWRRMASVSCSRTKPSTATASSATILRMSASIRRRCRPITAAS